MLSSPDTLVSLPAEEPSSSYQEQERAAPPLKPVIAPLDWLRAGFFAALGVALLALLLLVAWRLSIAVHDIITPFVVAFVVALLLNPLVGRLQRRGLSRAMAVGLIFGSLLLLLVGASILIVPALIAQASQLSKEGPRYVQTGQAFINTFLEH